MQLFPIQLDCAGALALMVNSKLIDKGHWILGAEFLDTTKYKENEKKVKTQKRWKQGATGRKGHREEQLRESELGGRE